MDIHIFFWRRNQNTVPIDKCWLATSESVPVALVERSGYRGKLGTVACKRLESQSQTNNLGVDVSVPPEELFSDAAGL